MAVSGNIGTKYVYTLLVTASSINLDGKYITTGSIRRNGSSYPGPFTDLSRKDAETLCAFP
jgi:hypothetical protein